MLARRIRTTCALFIVTLFIVTIASMRSTGPARAAFAPDPYRLTEVVDTNPDPDIVETTLTAEAAAVDIGGGRLASVLTFNGTVPGPQFRVKVGDTVIVHFVNKIAHVTGIHWHGIQTPNASDGTPITQDQVEPDGTFLYKFVVNRPGLYWYHPHHHSSTNQIFKGLYGSIVVTDPNEAPLIAAGVVPPPADTRTLVLSDITVCKPLGSNDAVTYDPALPFVGGGPLPVQPGPTPKELCETSPIDEDGKPRGAYAAGDVPNIQKAGHAGRVNEGQTVLTNGIDVGGRAGTPSAPGALSSGASVLDVQAGQGLRLQLLNTAQTRFFRLRLTTSAGALVPLVRIGGQGGLLDRAVIEGGNVGGFDFKYGAGEILIDPGDRADVVAVIPSSATGVLTLWTEDFSRTGHGFAEIPTVPVAHFNVVATAPNPYSISAGTALRETTGDLVPSLGAATVTLLNPATFTQPKPGMASQAISLTQSPGNSLSINGIVGSHETLHHYTDAERPASTRYAPAVPVGSILELTVPNLTGAHHPFHLHGFQIQPIDLTKAGSPTYTFPYKELKDTVDIPPQYTLRFRVRIVDRPLMDGTTAGGALGRWAVHCHIVFHAVFGMISEFDVVDSDGNERPYINSDATSVTGTDTFAMSGSFYDGDGDTVSLSASSGSITTTDASHWTWSRTGGQSGLVYVTATDSRGLKDQIAFRVTSCATQIVIGPPILAGGVAGVPYAVTLTQIGAAIPATFAVTNGALPPGLTLSNTGVLSGTPSLSSTFTFAVTVTDANGCSASRTYQLAIACGPTPQLPATLPSASVGSAYRQVLSSGGVAATFSISSGALPAGLMLSSDGVLAGMALRPERATFTISGIEPAGKCDSRRDYTIDVNADRWIMTGAGPGGTPTVRTLRVDGTAAPRALANFLATATTFAGGVRVASGDVTGDGVADAIVAPASGAAIVRVFDGVSGALVREAPAFPGTPSDGVYVAVADVNADGALDVITGIGNGPPLVRVFDVRAERLLLEFTADAIGTSDGVRVAAGDLNGDSFPEIITSAGPGGEPAVAVFDTAGTLLARFLAYPSTFGGGVYVAAGDVNGDGFADIVTGAGAGEAPYVRVWDARTRAEMGGFFAYSVVFLGGVRVATGDLNGDGRAEIITGAGPGGAPHVRVWDPVTRSEIGSFNAYPPGFLGGVFVAAQVPQNALVVDGPGANAVLSGPFTISGWAIAEGSTGNAGVSSVGALAFPLGQSSPIFLGEMPLDRPRLDVASIFGGQYAVSGFRIDNVTLAPGSYDLAIGAVNARTRTITQFRVVRVQIR